MCVVDSCVTLLEVGQIIAPKTSIVSWRD